MYVAQLLSDAPLQLMRERPALLPFEPNSHKIGDHPWRTESGIATP